MSTNVWRLPAHDPDGARDLTAADWARLERNAGEIFAALGSTWNARHTGHAAALRARVVRRDSRLRRRPEAAHALPDGEACRRRRPPRADRRGPRRVLRALRAPCAAVPRTRSRRLRRRRRDPRHLQAHTARTPLRAALHRAGALAEEIADGLQQLAGARGVAVRLEAAHLCTAMRGVEEDGSVTVTTVWRGLYDEEETLRSEFLR